MADNIEWEDLGNYEQDKYIRHASYLIERNYIEDETDESLAKKMYMKEKSLDTNSTKKK